MLMTPRNPWSFFLNFFWSKIWTVTIEESLTSTSKDSFQSVQTREIVREGISTAPLRHSSLPSPLTHKGSGFSV